MKDNGLEEGSTKCIVSSFRATEMDANQQLRLKGWVSRSEIAWWTAKSQHFNDVAWVQACKSSS